MAHQETLELLKKGNLEVKKGISSIKNVLTPMKSPEFKLMVIEYKDKLKTYEDEIETKLSHFNISEQEQNKVGEALSKIMSNTKLLLEKTDKHIAALIFDTCHDCIKELYKTLNNTSTAEKDVREIATGIIHTMTTLREHLMTYL